MSKLDQIKANIAFHEKMFFAALAVFAGLAGWAATHYQTISAWLMVLCCLGLFCAAGFLVWSYRHIKRLIEELADV